MADKMRLCSKCGIILKQIDHQTFSCPRGHGEWKTWEGITDQPVPRFNDQLAKTYERGEMEFGGGNKSGRKKKKKPPSRKEISSKYLEIY